VEESKAKTGKISKLRKKLEKSRQALFGSLSSAMRRFPSLGEDFWEGIEETLIQADLGVETTSKVIDELKEGVKTEKIRDQHGVLELLKQRLINVFPPEMPPLWNSELSILLGIGVNGTGKTTTLAKIAHRAQELKKKALLVAADTYRAAAIEQLEIWSQRIGVPIVKHQRGGDSAAVVYDAIHAAQARGIDVLLVDTAGRLHTYEHLMEELKKIKRVALREAEEAKVSTLLVIDATTGQNAIAQTRLFNEALGVDGIALTKLDGTAKGGIVVALYEEFKIPIQFVGLGEGLEDLEIFDAKEFIEGLFLTG